MELPIMYNVTFGKGDGSEDIDYDEIIVPEDQIDDVMYTLLTEGEDGLEKFSFIDEQCHEAYLDIEQNCIDDLVYSDDPYAVKCCGTEEKDIDELNDLVHSRNKHALAYFGLADASDDEIDKWDAKDLAELPTVADFDEDFEYKSPFDGGYDLSVFCGGVSIDDDDVKDYITRLFKKKDYDTIDSLLENINDTCFDGDLEEIIEEVAEELGVDEYIF